MMFRPGGQTFEDNCGLEGSESIDRFDFSVGYANVLVRELSSVRLT